MDPKHLIEAFGTIGVFLVVFAETGLLVGFFLPGDSLLFTAGLLCAPGVRDPVHLNLAVILPGVFVAAVVGAQVGHGLGRRFGPALFRRPESRLFRYEHVERAERYFARNGPKTVILARFVPVVRTFANVVAGVAGMEARTFAVYNVVGALVWSVGVTLLGYVLGRSVSDIDRYLLPAVAVIVAVSFVPVGLELLRARNRAGVGAEEHQAVGPRP